MHVSLRRLVINDCFGWLHLEMERNITKLANKNTVYSWSPRSKYWSFSPLVARQKNKPFSCVYDICSYPIVSSRACCSLELSAGRLCASLLWLKSKIKYNLKRKKAISWSEETVCLWLSGVDRRQATEEKPLLCWNDNHTDQQILQQIDAHSALCHFVSPYRGKRGRFAGRYLN